MKKLIVFAAFTMFAGLLPAQITITKNDMPAAGDSFKYATVMAVGSGINVKNTGTNFTWDYSQLTKNDSTIIRYERSAQTPYAFYFFNTMGQKIADNLGFGQFSFSDVYSFYKTTNTDFTAEGIGFKFSGFPLAGFYTNKDEIYHFPLMYGDRDSSNFRVEIQLPTLGSYKQSGKRVNNVDGWGTLKLPGGVTHNCIRIKSVISQVDSVSATQPLPISFGFPSTRVEYKWLTNTDKVPVLEVQGTELAGNFTPTTIRYRENFKINPGPGMYVGETNVAAIKIYPNPAVENIYIETPGNIPVTVKLYSIDGRLVPVSQRATDARIVINSDQVAQGVYMVVIETSNGLVTQKVEIKH